MRVAGRVRVTVGVSVAVPVRLGVSVRDGVRVIVPVLVTVPVRVRVAVGPVAVRVADTRRRRRAACRLGVGASRVDGSALRVRSRGGRRGAATFPSRGGPALVDGVGWRSLRRSSVGVGLGDTGDAARQGAVDGGDQLVERHQAVVVHVESAGTPSTAALSSAISTPRMSSLTITTPLPSQSPTQGNSAMPRASAASVRSGANRANPASRPAAAHALQRRADRTAVREHLAAPPRRASESPHRHAATRCLFRCPEEALCCKRPHATAHPRRAARARRFASLLGCRAGCRTVCVREIVIHSTCLLCQRTELPWRRLAHRRMAGAAGRNADDGSLPASRSDAARRSRRGQAQSRHARARRCGRLRAWPAARRTA